MTPGKAFEQDFKHSIGMGIYYQRIYDQAAGFGESDHTRFALKNPFDCIVYQYPLMLLLELKSFKGKSFAASRIKDHQAASLLLASKYQGIVPGYVLNFRDHETALFMHIGDLIKAFESVDKKSLNQSDCLLFGGVTIEAVKKRTRFSYNAQKMITDIKSKYL
jgi:penicillin-binding protein-related factor A (putative recombinase)